MNMKIEIEVSDIRAGAEFVGRDGARYLVVWVSSQQVRALVELKSAHLLSLKDDKDIAAILTTRGAVPLWLHEAKQKELKRQAQLSDD